MQKFVHSGICGFRNIVSHNSLKTLQGCYSAITSRSLDILNAPSMPFKCDSRTHASLSSSIAAVAGKELQSTKDFSLVDKVNLELDGALGPSSRLFAVIHAAGKQRKITTEDIVVLDKPIEATVGDRIRLNKVLLVGGKNFTVIGRPILGAHQAKVEATVIEKTLSHGKVIFWYIRRKRHRVFKLRKESLVYLRINSIELSPLNKSN